MRGKYASHNFFSIYYFLLFFPLPLFSLFPTVYFTEKHTRYQNNALGCASDTKLPLPVLSLIQNDIPSHSKYTIFGIFCRSIHGSRDAETYDFSCVSWINNAIIPEPCCGVIRTSFFLICLHNLCLESFLFFLVPLHYIMQSVCQDK